METVFPTTAGNHVQSVAAPSTPGISLRDHIAIEYMKAVASNSGESYSRLQLATCAYDMADLMLKARNAWGEN